jgi:hypothetical protein
LFYVGYGLNDPETGITATNGSYLLQPANWVGPGDVEWLDFDTTSVYADFQVVSVPDSVTIGGNVTGLVGSGLVLQNNSSDDLSIDADGEFTFVTPLTPGDSYDVTVFTQPDGQFCSVENGSGEATDVNVTDVLVTCGDELDSVTIGGTVFGLDADSVLLLQNNDTDYEIILENGDYVFGEELIPGDSYDVSVLYIFPEQTCIVVNGSGEVPPQNVTNVLVACGPAADQFAIGGTVTGLESDSGLVLQNNGADDKPIAANGSFSFDTPLLTGSPYVVTVLTNPTSPAQDCFVSGGDGYVADEDVTNVAVTCAPPIEGPPPLEEYAACEREACAEDEVLQNECNLFMDQCLEEAGGSIYLKNQCSGTAFLMCGF